MTEFKLSLRKHENSVIEFKSLSEPGHEVSEGDQVFSLERYRRDFKERWQKLGEELYARLS